MDGMPRPVGVCCCEIGFAKGFVEDRVEAGDVMDGELRALVGVPVGFPITDALNGLVEVGCG